MSTRTLARLAVLAVATAAVAACASDSTSPLAPGGTPRAPRHDLASAAVPVVGLQRDLPIASPITVSAVIPRSGGTLKINETGLKLVIPPNAFDEAELVFTATALPGRAIAYEFTPHRTFNVPLTIEQDTKGTALHKLRSLAGLSGAYFADASQVNATTGVAMITELRPLTVDLMNAKLRFTVEHFSGYMVSSGRYRDEME